MLRTNVGRRSFLKGGLVTGAATLTGSLLPSARAASAVTRLPAPPEASILSSKEYGQKRIRKVQEAMRKNELDALIVSNRALDYVGYVTNFHPSSMGMGVVFIPADGAPTLYVSLFSPSWVPPLRKTTWADDVVDAPKDFWSESSSLNFFKEVISKLKDRKLTRGRIGFAGGEIDWMLPYYFRSELPGIRVEDANRMLYDLVIVKDDVELGLMRHSQRINDEVAYPEYQKLLTVGAIDADVQADVLAAMLKAGATSSTRLSLGAAPYTSGTWGGPITNRRIQKGDIILTEPVPSFLGYQTEKMFTFAMGKDIAESQKRGAQVIYESFLLTMDELKPGREMRPIFEKCENYIKGKGFQGATVVIGHWIGMAGNRTSHEGARITSEGTKGLILKPGMALSWHPNVVIPGEVRTCCSACLLITEKGVEMMTKIPMEPMNYL